MTVAIYPGSFDPVHLGHLDIIERASRVFDRVVIAVARNSEKEGLFTPAERLEMLEASVGEMHKVEVDAFDGLTVDFEYELKQASMNARLAPDLDTVFFMTSAPYYFLSSTLIREVARLGGPVTGLVPAGVEERLRAKFRRK